MLVAREIHAKIIDNLKKRGPSLPIQLARDLNMNSIFISAFLSELLDDKKIKMSYLKVGGTHLYLLEGQEKELEKFNTYLHPKEIEAYNLLKENKVLRESDQDPAIRVALKSIKDFSIPMKIGDSIYFRYMAIAESEANQIINSEKTYYIEKKEEIILKKIIEPQKIEQPRNIETKDGKMTRLDSERKMNESFELPKNEKELPKVKGIPATMMQEIANHQNKVQIKPAEPKKETEDQSSNESEDFKKKFERILEKTHPQKMSHQLKTEEKSVSIEEIVGISKSVGKEEENIKEIVEEKSIEEKKEITNEFRNPFISKPEEKTKKEKPRSGFVLKVMDFIEKNFKLIEEKDHKAKEYLCIISAESSLGPINFLTQAKDKKLVSDSDLHRFLTEAQSIPLPALVLYTGDLSKKAKEYLQKYSSIIKAKKID